MSSSVIVPPDEVGGAPDTGRSTVNIQVLEGHTAFFGIKDFLPEDILWRKEHPRTPSLVCLQEDNVCECPWGCVAKLAARCHWLFEKKPNLAQLFLLFNRGEAALRRRVPPKEINNDLTESERQSFKITVPRVFALHVERDFYRAKVPFRLFRVNYNSLEILLGQTDRRSVPTPLAFWSGLF